MDANLKLIWRYKLNRKSTLYCLEFTRYQRFIVAAGQLKDDSSEYMILIELKIND